MKITEFKYDDTCGCRNHVAHATAVDLGVDVGPWAYDDPEGALWGYEARCLNK